MTAIFFSLILYIAVLRTWKTVSKYVFETIRNTETQTYKDILSHAMPIIDVCYNSGTASLSFSGELHKLFEILYGINLMNPQTILNSQFAIIGGYSAIRRSELETTPLKTEEEKNPPQHEYTQDDNHLTNDDDYEQQKKQPEDDKDLIMGQKVAIRNETDLDLDIDALAAEPLELNFSGKGPSVLILHTHTTESYSKVYKFLESDEPGWDRNPKNNVVRVGAELADKLKKLYGIDVIHNGTVHDYPSYSGSYNRSLETAQRILKSYPTINIVVDIHRDGLSENKKFRAVKNINGVNAAQIMFVVGTDESGLYHPNWKENFKLAIQLQKRLNAWYPELARPINLRTGRFNQHVAPGALIIEVGGDGNTLEEALESTTFLARAIGSLKEELK